jgi:hypothetical protein
MRTVMNHPGMLPHQTYSRRYSSFPGNVPLMRQGGAAGLHEVSKNSGFKALRSKRVFEAR